MTKYGCTKQAMHWMIWVQHFFFFTTKSTRDVVIMPFAFLQNEDFFRLSGFLCNSTQLIHEVIP